MESLLKDRPTVEAPSSAKANSESTPAPTGKNAFVGFGDFLVHREQAKIAASGQAPTSTPSPVCEKPEVEVVKEDGVIVRLIVTCKCGERTEIDCSYD